EARRFPGKFHANSNWRSVSWETRFQFRKTRASAETVVQFLLAADFPNSNGESFLILTELGINAAMLLKAGAILGTYEVVDTLGAGGMGEVYRARDTKLKRDVAIKILPEAFSSDPERLARFQREAEVLASLNHPNIATIYDLEE